MIQLTATQITAEAAQNAQRQQHRSDLLWFFNPFVNFPKAVTLFVIPQQISLVFARLTQSKQTDSHNPAAVAAVLALPQHYDISANHSRFLVATYEHHFRCVRKISKNDLVSSCRSVCPCAWNKSSPTGRIFIKFDIHILFENLSK
jgi:hypothetical protein